MTATASEMDRRATVGNMITADTIRDLIVNHDAARPRSKQTAIGPSDLSSTCSRRLVYQLLGVERVAQATVNLAAWVGTQIHAGMEATVKGDGDWITEQRVSIKVRPGLVLTGSMDAYHKPSGTVIDYKSVGPSALQNYRRRTPDKYLTQVAIYGLGAVLSGYTVHNTALVYIPRNGDLSEIHVDCHPWDQDRADAAVARLEQLHTVAAAGTAVLPMIPVADDCRYCPWLRPGSDDVATGCPGAKPKDLAADLPPWEPEEKEKAQ